MGKSADEKAVRDGLSAKAIRDKYPGRPKVRGEHYAVWEWAGSEFFHGKIGNGRELTLHRHGKRSFPESAFAELEEKGFKFVRWAKP